MKKMAMGAPQIAANQEDDVRAVEGDDFRDSVHVQTASRHGKKRSHGAHVTGRALGELAALLWGEGESTAIAGEDGGVRPG